MPSLTVSLTGPALLPCRSGGRRGASLYQSVPPSGHPSSAGAKGRVRPTRVGPAKTARRAADRGLTGHEQANALNGARYAWWKNPVDLTDNQIEMLACLAKTDPRLRDAYPPEGRSAACLRHEGRRATNPRSVAEPGLAKPAQRLRRDVPWWTPTSITGPGRPGMSRKSRPSHLVAVPASRSRN